MKQNITKTLACLLALASPLAANARGSDIACGNNYSVVSGDTLSRISLRAYGSLLYQPIYTANIDVIGSNPDMIYVAQSLKIPCLEADFAEAVVEGQLVFKFNKASAPPFIINSGIVDAYLAEITEVTEGRVTFIDPDEINRDHTVQLDLVQSGEVDGAYVLNSGLAESHPLLQLPMLPMFGGSAEQTAVSMWRLHEDYLAETGYFDEAKLLGFISAPAAHIWRDSDVPVTADESIAAKNAYHTPYFFGLDTRGPAVMREEFTNIKSTQSNEPATYFMAHGAAIALGLWNETANVSVMEVDNGLYTPTFSVVLSNEAWAQISAEDQQRILEVSGSELAHRSAAWDDFDNSFRSRMLDLGLDFEKADKALLDNLWLSSLDDLNSWIMTVDSTGESGREALNSYIASLRTLEDRLIYRGNETFVDQHPFVSGGL